MANNANGPTINNKVVERMATDVMGNERHRMNTLARDYLTYGNISVAAIVSNIFLRLIISRTIMVTL